MGGSNPIIREIQSVTLTSKIELTLRLPFAIAECIVKGPRTQATDAGSTAGRIDFQPISPGGIDGGKP